MNLTIRDYSPDMDEELLDLFYKSNFYKRKEFEYVRVPDSWIYRYTLNTPYIVKVAFDRDRIIGSLGLVTRDCKADGRNIRTGCFVDNCILPEYLNSYDEIFSMLFSGVEADARKEGIDAIVGWTFLKHYKEHNSFWYSNGFAAREGFNFFIGGSDFKGAYPYPQKRDININWKILLKIYKNWIKIKEYFLEPCDEKVRLRMMKNNDLEMVSGFLKKYSQNADFASNYRNSEYISISENNHIFGIVAEKDLEIVGVLTFINSAGSGGMYGTPHYDREWEVFFSFIVDEFVISQALQDSALASNMILKLMKIKDPEKEIENRDDYTFVSAVFDRNSVWMRKAFLKLGFSEPKFDYGVVLGKSLNDDVKLDTDKIWHLPTRCILAPVPRREELQRLEPAT